MHWRWCRVGWNGIGWVGLKRSECGQQIKIVKDARYARCRRMYIEDSRCCCCDHLDSLCLSRLTSPCVNCHFRFQSASIIHFTLTGLTLLYYHRHYHYRTHIIVSSATALQKKCISIALAISRDSNYVRRLCVSGPYFVLVVQVLLM